MSDIIARSGDRVRILEIDPRDPSPTVKVGDVVTLFGDVYDYDEFPFICSSRADIGTYAKFEIVQPSPDPGAEAVDAANAARPRLDYTKDTNPKDAVAVAHLKFSTIPWRVMSGVALALSEGAWKYGRHNYRVAGVKASVYFDACLDHLFAWFEGEDIDPDSGRHHIDKAIAGLFVLRDCMLGGKVDDDRPPAVAPGWIAEGHEATKALLERMREKYPTPKAPFVRK